MATKTRDPMAAPYRLRSAAELLERMNRCLMPSERVERLPAARPPRLVVDRHHGAIRVRRPARGGGWAEAWLYAQTDRGAELCGHWTPPVASQLGKSKPPPPWVGAGPAPGPLEAEPATPDLEAVP